jgi:hypothetical protein
VDLRALPDAYAETLRRLTLADEPFVTHVLGHTSVATPSIPALDPLIQGLVRVGALIAIGAGTTSIDHAVADSLAAGASPRDVVDVLLTVAPSVGTARTVSAAPRIAAALGYDVGAALESLESR